MQKFMDAGLGRYFESAMHKLRSVLKSAEKDWVAQLEKQVWAKPSFELFNKAVPNAMEILFNSIAGRTQVNLKYLSANAEQPQDRRVEPVGLFHESSHWYLLAYCHLRKDYRQFRTDRILAITKTDQPFTLKHGSIEDYLNRAAESNKPLRIVIAVKKDIVRYIGEGKKYYGFVTQQEKGDEVEMVFITGT